MLRINTQSENYTNPFSWKKKNKRETILKWVIALATLSAISFVILCRLEINAHVFIRDWISPQRPLIIEPLSKCFENLPQEDRRFTANFVPGLPVWEANTCYDFAHLFQPSKYPYESSQSFHTYWSSNLTRRFDEKPMATLRSFASTQSSNYTLTLWVPAEDEENLIRFEGWKALTEKTHRVRYKVIQPRDLVNGTALEPYVDRWRFLVSTSRDGTDDLLRMLVLYQHGGVWFDLDTMLIRDLGPLFEHEWIAQGSCKTGIFGNPFTGVLFHFHRRSPYVCEILEGAGDLFGTITGGSKGYLDVPKRSLAKETDTFGSKLYYRVYRRLLHHQIRPWSILPWCFTDPSQCEGNSLPSLFTNTDVDKEKVERVFAYHWRARWNYIPGSLFNYLDLMHKKKTSW